MNRNSFFSTDQDHIGGTRCQGLQFDFRMIAFERQETSPVVINLDPADIGIITDHPPVTAPVGILSKFEIDIRTDRQGNLEMFVLSQ